MRKTTGLAALMAASLALCPGPARSVHNTVTLSAPQVTRGSGEWRLVNGRVNVRNTTNNAETGPLTLILFQVDGSGKVMEVARRDLGIVTLPAQQNASVNVEYFVPIDITGAFVALGDYASVGVAHTHSGTYAFRVD